MPLAPFPGVTEASWVAVWQDAERLGSVSYGIQLWSRLASEVSVSAMALPKTGGFLSADSADALQAAIGLFAVGGAGPIDVGAQDELEHYRAIYLN